ncbi:HPSE [Symbiodinium sp. CCMP2592]|nr:HPSE [Symbiodinium sp. CCMP2592]
MSDGSHGQLVGFLLLIAGLPAYEATCVVVGTDAPVHTTLEGHAAWSIEFGGGVKHGYLDDSRLVNLCKALGPSILRVGGSSQDEVTYDFGVKPQEGTFGPSDIDKVFRFANATGWLIVWGLSYMRRPESATSVPGPVNLAQLAQVLQYHLEHDRPFGYELGNEPDPHCPDPSNPKCSVSVKEHVQDDLMLSQLLQYTYALAGVGSDHRPLVIGPDAAHCCNYLENFTAAAAAAKWEPDVLTWHHYYFDNQSPVSKFVDPRTLDSLQSLANLTVAMRDKYTPRSMLWVGESASAWGGGVPNASDRFAAIFTDLDQVATLSRLGYTGVVRQGLFGSGGYSVISAAEGLTPNPSYWAYLAYKRFMGARVLEAGELGGYVRSYAHCHPTLAGAITVMILNVSPKPSTVTVLLSSVSFEAGPPNSWTEYHLTMPPAAGMNLTTTDIAVNGKVMKAHEDGTVPAFLPKQGGGSGGVTLKPYSAAFLVFEKAQAPACSGVETVLI